ncbi:exodeoxyribonuclease V subunit gamma [Psychrobacter sp. DM4]|uniref:exodeoxyribonuclease V subunit gamma n=1 Tax=Psychrobacter sp. DM4 TaxID=3440637 RepID=UPI003F50C7AF
MFTIIQSHLTERLVEQLLTAYQSKNQGIFDEFIVIVPSMVLGDWLDKSIASQAGISTLVTTTFWGQYQWTLMQKVLSAHNEWLEANERSHDTLSVPEVAVLTGSVMQWRLFGYFTYYQAQIIADDTHPLHPLLSALLDDKADRSQQDIRLWSLATDFARVFSRYLTHREDWLTLWSQGKPVDAEALIKDKDELSKKFDEHAGMTPEWLVAHYVELESAQRHLWRLLFASVYEHRQAIEKRFWQIMRSAKEGTGIETGVDTTSMLPTQLHIFTLQQLPQNELTFLQKLSTYFDITLLHYNPSKLFWADIVDKQWLQRQQVINPKSVFLRDHGHTLLSRLGKQSRETFAMLAELDSNDNKDGFLLDWQDKFDEPVYSSNSSSPTSLLANLQQDILMLDESATQQTTAGRLSAALGAQMQLDLADDSAKSESTTKRKNSLSSDSLSNNNSDLQSGGSLFSDDSLQGKRYEQARQWQLSQYDNSLSIHSCHSLQRQLEVLRGMIGRWLNEPSDEGSARHVSDIVVLLPDVERHHELINSIFVNGEGQDGLTLPAKVTGVVDKSIRQLWEAIRGFYSLLGSDSARFEAAEVFDWLMLPPLYESLGLTHEQMSRACDLLAQAGFVRGFDEAHFQQTLDASDYDYRFSFAYALDQIALGLVMPEAKISGCLYPDNWLDNALAEKTIPIASISLSDAPIVQALCRVYAGLDACRYEYQARHKAEDWLALIENSIIHPYFGDLDQTRPMRAIFNAMNGFKSSLRANRHYQQYRAELTESEDAATMVQDENQQVETRLAKVSNLTLKLSFMLDSIEDELESQQVSAEPTGVITFGRFGALRNVPFGLVVMLNMDLSEFPNRDKDNRYDLMKSGVARRGDRFSEDDDNGAFLDAMLCARNACWIFYNGQRLTDTHEHLPANPVSELLQFLQGEVQWQWDPLERAHNDAGLTGQVQRYLPKLIEQWLVTRHPALPFAPEVFVEPQPSISNATDEDAHIALLSQAMFKEKLNQQRAHAPARVWQQVFGRLQAQESMSNTPPLKVKLPSAADYQAIAERIQANEGAIDEPFDIVQVDMEHLYYQARHPAKHFLREQQVHIVLPEDDTVHQEPLSLSGLNAYTINTQLLTALHSSQSDSDSNASTSLLYNPVMPAGVARQSTLRFQQLKMDQQCDDFCSELAALGIHTDSANLITPCSETITTVHVPDMNAQGQLTLKGTAPQREQAVSLWLNLLPNSARTQYLLRFWLAHLYWQVARSTTSDQVIAEDGKSIWRFNKPGSEHDSYKDKTTFKLMPMECKTARAELLKWVRFAHIAGKTPLIILPVHALTFLHKVKKAQSEGAPYQPKRSDFDSWLRPSFNSDMTFDTCAQHELWQYVLDKHDNYNALMDALPTLSSPLFDAMNKALQPL